MTVFAFIDESGKPGLREEDPFVLAALLVEENLFLDLEHEISRIVARILGPYGLSAAELHAKELIQGKKDFASVPLHARVQTYIAVIKTIAQYATRGFVEGIIVEIHKNFNVSPSEEDAKKCIVRKAYQLMLERIAWAHYDHKRNDLVILVIDESELDAYVKDIIKEEIVKGKYTSKIPSSKKILVDPIFANSAHYRCLQAADLIAYTARRVATKTRRKPSKTDKYFQIENVWNIIWGEILRKGPQGNVLGYGYKIFNVAVCEEGDPQGSRKGYPAGGGRGTA